MRLRNWPGYTQWYCCHRCGRLWTFHEHDVVMLESQAGLGAARPSEGVAGRACSLCEGRISYVRAESQPVVRDQNSNNQDKLCATTSSPDGLQFLLGTQRAGVSLVWSGPSPSVEPEKR